MEKLAVIDISQLGPEKRQNDFFANKIPDHILKNKSKITKPHKHNSYLAVLFTKGSGRHEVDFNSYDIKPGSLFLLSPGQSHHWELSEDIDGYIFSHTGTFYDLHYSHIRIGSFPFFHAIQNTPCLALDKKSINLLSALFRKLFEEYNSTHAFKHQLIVSYIDIIYVEAARLYLNENPKYTRIHPYSEKLQQFEMLLEKNYESERLPSRYAAMMNISPKHLNRIAKSVLGKTASEIISDRVVLEAKRRMLHAKNNLAAVADSLGFDDYAYFSKLFKKASGLTPTQFLNSYR